MAQLLSVADTDAVSGDFTIAAGTQAVLSLKAGTNGSVPPNAKVFVERKDAGNVYTVIGRMDAQMPAVIVENPGTEVMNCRVRRANSGAVGTDRG